MSYDAQKNLKAAEIENFTITSEISDNVLSTLWNSLRVWTKANFLKLDFSIFIIWPQNFFGGMFKYIQNFCLERCLMFYLLICKTDFFEATYHFFMFVMCINYQIILLFYCLFSKKFTMVYRFNLLCLPCPARHKATNSKSILAVKNMYLFKSISNISIVGLTSDWCIAKA